MNSDNDLSNQPHPVQQKPTGPINVNKTLKNKPAERKVLKIILEFFTDVFLVVTTPLTIPVMIIFSARAFIWNNINIIVSNNEFYFLAFVFVYVLLAYYRVRKIGIEKFIDQVAVYPPYSYLGEEYRKYFRAISYGIFAFVIAFAVSALVFYLLRLFIGW